MSALRTILEAPQPRRVEQRRQAVIGLYGLAAFGGVAQVVAADHALLQIVLNLCLATLATLWFAIDRRIYSRPHIPILQLLFFVSWPIASLPYLILTRGPKGIMFWGLHAFGMLLVMYLTLIPTAMLLSWVGWLELETLPVQ